MAKKDSVTFVPNGNENIESSAPKSTDSGEKDRFFDDTEEKRRALRQARLKSPYYDQGGGCNW